jgi:hypothetical protein
MIMAMSWNSGKPVRPARASDLRKASAVAVAGQRTRLRPGDMPAGVDRCDPDAKLVRGLHGLGHRENRDEFSR